MMDVSTDLDSQENAENSAEGSLISRHLAGDKTAFPKLVAMYKTRIYSWLWKHGLSSAESEDLFQEIFLQIHLKAKHYDPTRALTPWIFALAVNLVRDYFRSNSKRRAKLQFSIEALKESELTSSCAMNDNPSLTREAKETAAVIAAKLEKLPQVQREAFLLATVRDMSLESVANIVGQPINTIKSYVHRTRLELAQALKQQKSHAVMEVRT